MENNIKTSLKDISVKDRWRIYESIALITSAIVLYFLSFAFTFTIGLEIVSAGLTLLGTGAALVGISITTKSQFIDFKSEVNDKLDRRLTDDERKLRNVIDDELRKRLKDEH